MNDPLAVLGLSPGASDEAVRARYLELVRTHSPDRDPKRFAEIRAAYDALRDPAYRVEKQIFGLATHYGIDDVLAEALQPAARKRFPTDLLLSLGK